LALSIDGDVENTLVLPYGGNRALPPTTLISPANGATEQPTTPQFIWAPAQDAIQYSLAIATSVSALPTGTQTSCSACTFFSPSPITATSYALASGILQLGVAYYWEVQADSGVYKGGNWSLPYSFTTGSSATQIQSVSVNPSSFGSGSYALVTVTLNGIAPTSGVTVGLTSSNVTAFPLPPSVEVLAGQNTASISVLSGPATTSTTATVRATYSGTQTASIVITPISGTTTTTSASSITASGAVTNGTINPHAVSGYAGFYWGTDPTMTVYTLNCYNQNWGNCPVVSANSSTQSFNSSLSGLSSNTTYYYQMVFYDANNGALQYGAIKSFVTKNPTVTTSAATTITSSGAVTNGTINSEGDSGYAGFYWGTDPTMTVYTLNCYNQNWGNCPVVSANSSTQSFNSSLGSLSSNTTYYYQMVFYDANNGALPHGAIKSFVTKKPTVTTSPATTITSSGAVTNGTINPEGDSGYAGFYWGTDPTMTVYTLNCYNQNWGNCPVVSANSSTQSFNSSLGSLNSNTTYYYQMVFYDANNGALQHGATLSFTTQ
jgi:hypothetical protein